MSDPTTDTATSTTTATPSTVTTTAGVKPGHKTTELAFGLLAAVLSTLFASGIIPTQGPIATVAAIAAITLTALGYTVSRTLVKTAALLALVVLGLGATQTACTGFKTDAKDAAGKFVDCTKPALATTASELVPAFADVLRNATGNTGKVDWAPVNKVAAPLKSIASQCAFASVIAELLSPKAKPGAPQSSPLAADPTDVLAGFGAIRAKWGGALYKTDGGQL